MEHLHEIVNRIAHLTGLQPEQVSTVPVEHHIIKDLKLEGPSEWRRQDPSSDAPCQGVFIKRALSNVPGVLSIDVNATATRVTIVHDPRLCQIGNLITVLNISTMHSVSVAEAMVALCRDRALRLALAVVYDGTEEEGAAAF